MLRLALITIPAVLALYVAAPAASPPPTQPVHVNTFVHEPILIFDVTGTTFSGEVHQNMTVYSSGFVSLCKFDAVPEDSQVRRLHGSPADAVDLLRDLFNAGAFSLEDTPVTGSDIPLKTVTVFRPSPDGFADATASSFSWYDSLPGTGYAEVFTILQDYIDQHFPDL